MRPVEDLERRVVGVLNGRLGGLGYLTEAEYENERQFRVGRRVHHFGPELGVEGAEPSSYVFDNHD